MEKWIVLVLHGVTGAIIGLIYAWNYKPKYTASLSFIFVKWNGSNFRVIWTLQANLDLIWAVAG